MRYNNFDLQDFLNDDSFVQWALFDAGEAYWQQVREDYPGKRDIMEQAREIIGQLREEEHSRTIFLDEEQVLHQIQRRIEAADSTFERPVEKRWKKNGLKWAVAGLCLACIGWVLLDQPFMRPTGYKELVAEASENHTLIEKVNVSDNPMKVILEDGTVVILKKNSRLSYPVHFSSDVRETFLSGEAFFEVAENPEKPFYVFANELVTKVLGTSFEVKAYDSERQVRVNVRSGQVSVYNQRRSGLTDAEAKGLVLQPNQQAVFDRKKESLSKHLVDDPMPVQPLFNAEKRRFEEVAVSRILHELEQVYGIRIIYNREVLETCVMSTVFGDEPLEDKLDIICQTIGATHKEIDAQIIIESTGCL